MSKHLRALVVTVASGLALLLATSSAPAAALPRVPVVAAENFYGDVVEQLAGDHVFVTSIISDPNVDPHEYESSAKDAAAVADARLVIQNGLGYDAFIDHLIAASPNPQRRLIVVANLTAHKTGDNPHIWYDPSTMPKVARAVVEYLTQIDSGSTASYRDRNRIFQASLRPLTKAIAALKAQYADVPVAVTEPVFNYMAEAVGLNVLTPRAFQKAIEEGEDPPAAALAQMEDQLRTHRVRVLLYNTQTVSPVTTKMQKLAKQLGIPVVGVSETAPPRTSYQQWMLGQVEDLRAALGQGK